MQSLPVLYIRTTNHYDVGKEIGRTFKHKIQEYHQSGDISARLQKFYKSTFGRAQFDVYLDISSKCFPEVVQELRGLADGAELSFDEIFLNQLLSEVIFVHDKEVDESNQSHDKGDKDAKEIGFDDVTHCTDILVNIKGFRMIAHNEDWGKAVNNLSFFTHVTLESESRDSIVEEFVSFVHPGLLPGLTFGMNKSLVLSVDTLLPVYANRMSVPVAILLRKLLCCQTIGDCVTTMTNKPYGCAYGINVNIASIHGNEMCTLEVYPEQNGSTSVTVNFLGSPELPPLTNYCCHCNHYTHTHGVKELECTKSRQMQSRVSQFNPPQNETDVRRILGDVGDVNVPIYKDPSPQNEAAGSRTVATAVFNITERKLDVYTSNPGTSQSCITIPFI